MDDSLFEYVEPVRVPSPCVNVCRLDAATGWCIGCGRTGDEITRWTAVGEAERDAVMAILPTRMTSLRERRRRGL
ncbi:DUF1289 domain-containing protein [Sphingomonas floccifaciens]|uniref:DUF1289 domain-containing protein n=1 Tax=Sphingomonas floccifaciens TaxID=1844115 RepID=A0ABW4N9X3_9SPHN